MLVQEKEAMSRRAGVLNLMLHSTFNHELAMLMQQQQAALHAKKQNRFDYRTVLDNFSFLMLKRALTKLPKAAV
jgi:hypothetical protein